MCLVLWIWGLYFVWNGVGDGSWFSVELGLDLRLEYDFISRIGEYLCDVWMFFGWNGCCVYEGGVGKGFVDIVFFGD